MPEIQKADQGARRRAAIFVLATAIIGSILIFILKSHAEPLGRLLLENSRFVTGYPWAGGLLGFIIMAPFMVFAVYLWRLGATAAREQRFPPPGAKVVRDTRITTGIKGVYKGRILQVLSVMIFAASLAASIMILLILRLAGP